MTDDPRPEATRLRRILGPFDKTTLKKPCNQGPGLQQCATCDARVGEPCALETVRAAMMAASPSPAGGT